MPETNVGRVIKTEEVAWETWSHGERFGSRVKSLAKNAGGSRVGVNIEELEPGFQSCPMHYHLLEEEHMFALEGTAILCWGDERITLVAGDFVSFPAGEKRAHALLNEGSTVFRFLMIGENNPNEVAFYPDSGKVMVRGAHRVFKEASAVDYWLDEPGRPPSP